MGGECPSAMSTVNELSTEVLLLVFTTLIFGTDKEIDQHLVGLVLSLVSHAWRKSVPRVCADYIVRDLGLRGKGKCVLQDLSNMIWVIEMCQKRGRKRGVPYRFGDIWNCTRMTDSADSSIDLATGKDEFLRKHLELYKQPYNPDDERLWCAETQKVPGVPPCVLCGALGDCHLLFLVPTKTWPYAFGYLWGYGPNYNGQLGDSNADLHEARRIFDPPVIAAAAYADVTVVITTEGKCYRCGTSDIIEITEWQPLSAWNDAKGVGRAIDVWTDGSCCVFLTMEGAVFTVSLIESPSSSHTPVMIKLPTWGKVECISLSSTMLAIIMGAPQGGKQKQKQELLVMDPRGTLPMEPEPIPKGRLLRVAVGHTHMVLCVKTETGDTKVYTALHNKSLTYESWHALAQGELGKESKGLQVASGLDGATVISAANYTTAGLLKGDAYVSCDQAPFPYAMGCAEIGENDGTPKKIYVPGDCKVIDVSAGQYHGCMLAACERPPPA